MSRAINLGPKTCSIWG